jgi:hypothetical protein
VNVEFEKNMRFFASLEDGVEFFKHSLPFLDVVSLISQRTFSLKGEKVEAIHGLPIQ